VLKIEGSDWYHPDKGLASLSRGKGAADYSVTYVQHQGVTCSYRISRAAGGDVLMLEAADETQLMDYYYCPTGKLLRAD
jgi:hypothetical protein